MHVRPNLRNKVAFYSFVWRSWMGPRCLQKCKPRSLVANKLRFAKREGPRLILLVCHLYLVSENRLTFIPVALDDTKKNKRRLFFPADANCTISPTRVSHPKTYFPPSEEPA